MATDRIERDWRFILSGHNDAAFAMAIDEAILTSYADDPARPTLRIYGWEPPAISLGYSQKAAKILDIERCRRDGIRFVRRTTGGEAIFHKDDVTYSIVCSHDDLDLPRPIKGSYRRLLDFIFEAYKGFGLEPKLFSETAGAYGKDFDSAFCYASSQDFDISIKGKKLGGNAQKRMRDIIFQHGSIPLSSSVGEAATYFKEDLRGVEKNVISLEEALGTRKGFDEVAAVLRTSFEDTFKVRLAEEKLSQKEVALADQLF